MFPVIAHHRFVHFREACAEPERCSRDDELQMYIDESLLNCFQSKFSSFDSRQHALSLLLWRHYSNGSSDNPFFALESGRVILLKFLAQLSLDSNHHIGASIRTSLRLLDDLDVTFVCSTNDPRFKATPVGMLFNAEFLVETEPNFQQKLRPCISPGNMRGCDSWVKNSGWTDLKDESEIDESEHYLSHDIVPIKIEQVRWSDVGALSSVCEDVQGWLHACLHRRLPARQPRQRALIFHGPPGTGKTMLAKAISTESGMSFVSVKGPELFDMYIGESERNIRNIFQVARERSPSILFFDELDSIAMCRSSSSNPCASASSSSRIVSQLLTEIDSLHSSDCRVLVIAATNRLDLIDPALLRHGRFDKIIHIDLVESIEEKVSMLRAVSSRFKPSPIIDFESVARDLPTRVSGAAVNQFVTDLYMSVLYDTLDPVPSPLDESPSTLQQHGLSEMCQFHHMLTEWRAS